jgi:Domain of unknown function (DUF4382)
MKSSKFYRSAFLIVGVIFIAAVFTACGGSGGGSSSGSAAPASGSVAVMLTDGPYDGLEDLFITVTKVSLFRADNGREVVVFDDPAGHEVDILSYQNTDYLLTLNRNVPVGTYNKIRLEVSDVRAVGGDCDADGIEIKLPSGKIDLNPRGTFQVVKGEALAIRLDIDAKKSFLLHKAGNSGKCIFRPVIFVDILSVDQIDSCPEVLKGSIVSLKYGTDKLVSGFVLDLNRGDQLQVSLNPSPSTVIFGEDGTPGHKIDINEVGKSAYVRGRIQSDGSLLASLVVIGDVLKVKGTANEAVAAGQYTMTLDPSQVLVGTSVEVGLDQSIILIDCDTPVDSSYIQPGVRTTVIGKYDINALLLRAAAVIVESRMTTGQLTQIDSVDGGSKLTIQPATGSPSTVFLPAGQNVYLQGDGVVDLDRLNNLYPCSNIQVRVLLDTATITTPPTTKKVYVIPEQMTSNVVSVSTGMKTILLANDFIIDVESDATVIKKTDGSYVPIELSNIQIGNEVTVFGLTNCKAFKSFYGYIVIVED